MNIGAAAFYPSPFYYPDYNNTMYYSPPPSPVPMTMVYKKVPLKHFENTNIYIRGLSAATSDQDLLKLVSPYGTVLSSKAIVDLKSGQCKGFGFAMYESVQEAQNALHQLNQMGYMVSFAVAAPRNDTETFNEKMQELADEESTNLYISNLPPCMTLDSDLANVFQCNDMISTKILLDASGTSRCVGFAKFINRAAAEKMMLKFHGVHLPNSIHPLQIRFADTDAQKKLKSKFNRTKKQNLYYEVLPMYYPFPVHTISSASSETTLVDEEDE